MLPLGGVEWQCRAIPLMVTSSQRDRLGVIILGMSRSGTSLTANVVSAAGAYVENSIPPSDDNPRGYWESREVVELNRRIMAHLGATLFWIPKVDSRWPEAHRLDQYRSRAKHIISELESYQVWALKDPRFSITLPFWLPLFNRPIRFILCIRNPLESVQSAKHSRRINQRDLSTWHEYAASALRNTASYRRIIVHFHRYFCPHDSSQVTRILEFLGLEPSVDASAVISPGLFRNRFSLEDLFNDERVPSNVKDLYARLLDLGGVGTGKSRIRVDILAPERQSLIRAVRTLFFRAYGFAWVTFRDNPLYPRLPRFVRKALTKTLGMWSG